MNKVKNAIFRSCIKISKLLRDIHLDGTGIKGHGENASGDKTTAFDNISNDVFVDLLSELPEVCAIVSEELENVLYLNSTGRYVVIIDPLDGSANLEINSAVSTIFSIVEVCPSDSFTENQICEKAKHPVLAGVCLYGFSTTLLVAESFELNLFSLGEKKDDFVLLKSKIKMPDVSNCIAINYSYYPLWEQSLKNYIDNAFGGERSTSPNIRWYASMAAELFRIILKGGTFLYPGREGKESGVIRKMYEAYPIAYICESSGGKCLSKISRMLDEPCSSIHEKTPIVFGSPSEIEIYLSYSKERYFKDSTQVNSHNQVDCCTAD